MARGRQEDQAKDFYRGNTLFARECKDTRNFGSGKT